MKRPLVPTVITDKNGVQTTRNKAVDDVPVSESLARVTSITQAPSAIKAQERSFGERLRDLNEQTMRLTKAPLSDFATDGERESLAEYVVSTAHEFLADKFPHVLARIEEGLVEPPAGSDTVTSDAFNLAQKTDAFDKMTREENAGIRDLIDRAADLQLAVVMMMHSTRTSRG